MKHTESLKAGFVYTVEAIDRDGNVIDAETTHNLVPAAGLDQMLDMLFNGNTVPSWFVGIYGNNYTPVTGDTAATFPSLAGELTAYADTSRPAYNPGNAAGGLVSNVLNKTEFVMTSDAAVRGGFITSSAVKGGTTGVLISAVQFSSPKTPGVGGTLRVTAGFQLTPA